MKIDACTFISNFRYISINPYKYMCVSHFFFFFFLCTGILTLVGYKMPKLDLNSYVNLKSSTDAI